MYTKKPSKFHDPRVGIPVLGHGHFGHIVKFFENLLSTPDHPADKLTFIFVEMMFYKFQVIIKAQGPNLAPI